MKFGNISDKALLKEYLSINCIPENIVSMDATHYEDFLLERRKLMAKKLKTITIHYDKKADPLTRGIVNCRCSWYSSGTARIKSFVT